MVNGYCLKKSFITFLSILSNSSGGASTWKIQLHSGNKLKYLEVFVKTSKYLIRTLKYFKALGSRAAKCRGFKHQNIFWQVGLKEWENWQLAKIKPFLGKICTKWMKEFCVQTRFIW